MKQYIRPQWNTVHLHQTDTPVLVYHLDITVTYDLSVTPVTYWLIQPCFVAPSSPAKSWQAEAGQGMSELGQQLVGYWSWQEHNLTHQTKRQLVSLAVNCWLQNNGHVFRYLKLVKKKINTIYRLLAIFFYRIKKT